MHGLGSWDVSTFIKAVAKDLVLDSQRLTFVSLFPLLPQLLKGTSRRVSLFTWVGRV